MTTDYKALKAAIDEYITSIGVTVTIKLIGDDCPMFCEDRGKPGIGTFPRKNHIHGQHYQIWFSRDKHLFNVDYWNSYRDAAIAKLMGGYCGGLARDEALAKSIQLDPYAKGYAAKLKQLKADAKVCAADVLGAVELFDPGSFEDFCGNFGYDTDSRKAETAYNATMKTYKDFARMFTPEELEALQEKVREL